MALIDEIREKIAADRFEFSKHAVDQSIIRQISVQEVWEIFRNAEVIEDYPGINMVPAAWFLAGR